MANWKICEFGPPDAPGVYAVLAHDIVTKMTRLLYIGSSQNIKKRVMSVTHPYRRCYDEAGPGVMVYTKFKVTEEHLDLERRLIKRLKPPYNTQYAR